MSAYLLNIPQNHIIKASENYQEKTIQGDRTSAANAFEFNTVFTTAPCNVAVYLRTTT